MSAGKDLYSNLSVQPAILPASISATTTPVSVDRRGYESVSAVVNCGAMTTITDGTNNFVITLVESVDGSTWTAVAAEDIIGGANNTIVTLVTASAGLTYTLGYKGNKRYVSVLATETGTAVAIFGATIVLGNPHVVA